MRFNNISIIGLGLIGGSLCKALRNSGHVKKITGVDADKSVVDYALYNDFIDEGTTSFMRGVDVADIVVICTHVDTIVNIAEDILPIVPDGCVVTDVGSVKGEIVKRIEAFVPYGKFFVGGHPIAGTEKSGITNSDPKLYRGKRIFLTPTPSSGEQVVSEVREMWETAGGRVSEIDPAVHDRIFSLVSHLPHVVAYSLVDSVLSNSEVENTVEYAGGGFRDFTRIASSSPEMWKEILLMNRKNVLEAIKRFRKSFDEVEYALENSDEKALLDFLTRASETKKGSEDI